MIKSLTIKNFQSHKNSYIEFDKGVNIIVGSTDCGKTAILRAMKWVIWNRPLGNSFRSSWGGDTEVTMEMDNAAIVRKEGKEKVYKLNDIEFKAFGTDIPEDIKTTININETNLQQQLDTPFLLKNTSGEIAAHFNKIAKLDKIDTGIQNMNSWIKSINKDIDVLSCQIEKSEKEIENYSHIEKFEIEVDILEQLISSKDKKQKDLWSLERLISKLKNIDLEIEKKSKITVLESQITEITVLLQEKQNKEVEKIKFEKLIKSINTISSNITTKEKLNSLAILIDSIHSNIQSRDKLQLNYIKLKKLCSNTNYIISEISEKTKLYNKKHKEFEENFPEQCPLCGK